MEVNKTEGLCVQKYHLPQDNVKQKKNYFVNNLFTYFEAKKEEDGSNNAFMILNSKINQLYIPNDFFFNLK